MKRILAGLLCVVIFLSLATVGASAATVDWSAVELQALYVQSDIDILSDLNEDYYEFWWEEEVPELDNYFRACTINMRGFAMSPDGRYLYMGHLNGGTGVRGVVVYDTKSCVVTDLYYTYDGDAGLSGSPFSYAKGIAADDRGYVYVGYAFSKNYNVVNLGIAKQLEDGTLEEVSFESIFEFGDPGAEGGIKVGVNGVDVAKVEDKYYCYAMINYDYDALYCIDVTDPENPKLNKDFGTNGCIIFSEPSNTVAGAGFTLKEGQYMDVDEDGAIWLAVNANEGKDGIMKISTDGSSCVDVIELSGVYSVEHYEGYLLCGLKDGSAVVVLDDTSYETIASIPLTAEYGDRVVRMQVINDVLFVADAGNDTTAYNAVHAAPLSMDGLAFFEELVANLSQTGDDEDDTAEIPEGGDTEADTADTPVGDVTEDTPVGDTTADVQDDATTEAPEDVTNGADEATTVASGEPAEGTTEETKSGCGAVMGTAAVVIMAAAAAFVVSKKD